jgi:hypothetical protein
VASPPALPRREGAGVLNTLECIGNEDQKNDVASIMNSFLYIVSFSLDMQRYTIFMRPPRKFGK